MGNNFENADANISCKHDIRYYIAVNIFSEETSSNDYIT